MSLQKPNKGKSIRWKRRIIIFFMLLIMGVAVVFVADKWVRKKGFTSFWDFITTVSTNYVSGLSAQYETAEITISEGDFIMLQSQRDIHLENGMITKMDKRYVPGLISYNGKRIKCKLRLKGHMTDHLQKDKWSFRVKTVGGDAFKGMRIFSLMHPGTRNYIYEWIYHQMLTQEDIATVRYSFIKLRVNGSDWGIYAVEENFGKELIANRRLPKGPILGLNPDLYWYARFNEHKKIRVDLENMDMGAAYPEAYDEEESFKNKEAKHDYAEAVLKLEKFRRGLLSTSEVFDIKKLAKFHAILDLVGGQFSLDWSDVKYYYNPITEKLEPVGYESFSVRNSAVLCGSSRFKKKHGMKSEWHEFLFSDPVFYEEYIKQLKRVSQPAYLNKFFAANAGQLKNNLAILYREFSYKKLTLDQYFINQKNIITLLNEPIIPVIYFNDFKQDTLYFTVGNNSLLPIEVNSLEVGNTKIKLETPVYFSTRNKNEPVVFETFSIYYPGQFTKNDLENIKFELAYPGITRQKRIKAKPIPFVPDFDKNDFISNESNLDYFDFVKVDNELMEIYLLSGDHTVNSTLVIPKGYRVKAILPFSLNLINKSAFISYSQVEFLGTEDEPIQIYSSDSSGKGIILLNVKDNSVFRHVIFSNLGLGYKKHQSHNSNLLFYNSSGQIRQCVFSSTSEIGLMAIRSELVLTGSKFMKYKECAFNSYFSSISLTNVEFDSNENQSLLLVGSKGNLNKLRIKSSSSGVRLENNSFIKGTEWNISDVKKAVSVNDYSFLKVDDIDLNKVGVGFHAEKKSEIYGPAAIEVHGLKKENVKKIKEADSRSKIIVK